jgi:glyoxylase-like metal-dependent hydrolase (beta-lactamase superfamily II)
MKRQELNGPERRKRGPEKEPIMKIIHWLMALALAGCLPASQAAETREQTAAASSRSRPELEYLRAVNQAGPPADPQLLFLLMAQYANANRAAEGVEFFSARLRDFGPRLSDSQRSLYLAAIGLLRARQAGDVSLLKRYGFVKDTIATLGEAERLSGGRIFVVRWMAGVVYAQLPRLFHQREAAKGELAWCLEHADMAPNLGWLREVHYQLASLARAEGDAGKAQDHLHRSGYSDFDRPITLTTAFSEDLTAGHAFSGKRISEVVPGRVYLLSGYEFTEYYFIVSADGRQLIAIDAGTRPDAAEDVYAALHAYAPRLPALSTVLITHAHWDHIGGHRAFRQLTPPPRFYARSAYRQELAAEIDGPGLFARPFFGQRFNLDDVRNFKPDVLVDGATTITVGGTRLELIPVQGGETADAMLINLPDEGVMFVGDIVMPYLGAPFVEEGSVEGLLSAIDVVVGKNPRRLLHGHEPLTRTFGTPAVLASLKPHLAWLREQVLAAVRKGDDRAHIHQANLIPAGLLTDPLAQIPYLLIRENLINRVFDQHVGYWQPNLEGVDHLGRSDQGQVLVDYLGLSERQLARAVQRMIADGKHELAASVVEATRGRYPERGEMAAAGRLAYLKLMEKYQEFNPFKFIIYADKAGEQVPPMGRQGALR